MKYLSNKEAMALLERTGHNTPTVESWGIASKDFSTGGFWWFENKETVLNFIRMALPAIEIYPEETENFDELMKNYLSLVQDIKPNDPEFQPILYYYNKYFSNSIELLWIGPFNDLLQSGDGFASFVREEFYENSKPVEQTKTDEFKEFVGEDVDWIGLYPSINTQLEASKEVFDDALENSKITENSILLFMEAGSESTRYFHPRYVFDNLEQWKAAIPFLTSMDINDEATEPEDFFYPVVDNPHLTFYNHYKNSVWSIADFESFVKKNKLNSGRIIFVGTMSHLQESNSAGARWIVEEWKGTLESDSLAEFLSKWNKKYAA